jgi:hypothetical protein
MTILPDRVTREVEETGIKAKIGPEDSRIVIEPVPRWMGSEKTTLNPKETATPIDPSWGSS